MQDLRKMNAAVKHSPATLGFAIKIKQGDILKAIRKRGWTQKTAAEFVGMDENRFCEMINLRAVPKAFTKEQASALVALTGKLPEDLFPEFIGSAQFQSLPHEFEFYQELTPEVVESAQQGLLPSSEDLAMEHERLSALETGLKTLDKRSEQIVRRRMTEWTFAEIGAEVHLTGERVREIYNKALSKLNERLSPPPPKPTVKVIKTYAPANWRDDLNVARRPGEHELARLAARGIYPGNGQPTATMETDED